MLNEKTQINGIPSIIWGKPSSKVYIHVHGKMSRKEYAEDFARIAEGKGYQTISFDLPEHGERENSDCRCDVWNGTHDLNVIAENSEHPFMEPEDFEIVGKWLLENI